MSSAAGIDQQLREAAPHALARLLRRYGDFDTCEDAMQEALLAAAKQWPTGGVPDNPTGWLVTVAARRLIEIVRQESARRHREESAARLEPMPPDVASDEDDSLTLLLLCCHPSLTQTAQVALTLRTVGGLTTAEIARAFLVPEATIGQRISRAKQRIKATGAEFALPQPGDLPARVDAVLQVLYLIFNEGYTATSGQALVRIDLTAEAIRLARELHTSRPDDGEVAGLLALMLLTDARRAARTHADGSLVPLAEQDRTRWDHAAIDEGSALITRSLVNAPVGPYQLQAAIAAVHAEARSAADTDWKQILGLYDLLATLAPGPMVMLNRIVAVATVHGADAALRRLAEAETEPALAGHHRVEAVRAHLLEETGDHDAAAAAYIMAARRTLSVPEQRYLESRARRLTDQ